MKRIYTGGSILSSIVEWLLTLVFAVIVIRMVLLYLYQHMGVIIGIGLLVIGGIIGYRIYDYKRQRRL